MSSKQRTRERFRPTGGWQHYCVDQLLFWSMGSIVYKCERDPEHVNVLMFVYENQESQKEVMSRDGRLNLAVMVNNATSDVTRAQQAGFKYAMEWWYMCRRSLK